MTKYHHFSRTNSTFQLTATFREARQFAFRAPKPWQQFVLGPFFQSYFFFDWSSGLFRANNFASALGPCRTAKLCSRKLWFRSFTCKLAGVSHSPPTMVIFGWLCNPSGWNCCGIVVLVGGGVLLPVTNGTQRNHQSGRRNLHGKLF